MFQVPMKSKPALFQVFQVFQVEHDEFAEAERAAIAVVDGRVPTAYADAWAAFQIRKPGHASAGDWYRAVDDAGRFLDAWARLALDFGWRPPDIFGSGGLAWFCAGERIRALGLDNAVTVAGRVFTRTISAPKKVRQASSVQAIDPQAVEP